MGIFITIIISAVIGIAWAHGIINTDPSEWEVDEEDESPYSKP